MLPSGVQDTKPRSAKSEGGEHVIDLVEGINGYIDHMHDATYVSGVVSLAPIDQLSKVLVNMLRGGEREAATNADLFVQDAVMLGLSPSFARYFPRSRVLRALRANITAVDYFTRHQCIHTLGRLGPRSNAQHFAAAFPWYLEHDVFNLDDLLGELFWLRPRTERAPYLEAIATAPLYLTRWSLLGHLLDHGTYAYPGWVDGRPPAVVLGYVQRLAEDDHPWVSAEAAWRLKELEARSAGAHATSGLEGASEPAPTFFALELHLGNYLWNSGRHDYDVALVEQIAAYIVEHPPYSGMDIDTYWAAFPS
jgi:hypothetical protein